MSDTPQSTPPAQEDAFSERDKLIAQLEKNLARPRLGVLPPVAAIAIVAAAVVAFGMKEDVAYFFSSPTPLELGAEGDYRFEVARSNRYAQVHGVPTARGWYVDENDGAFVVVGLNDTPLLVKRVTFADENRRLSDGKRPQPRQNPFFARGRLLSRTDASKYEDVFREFETWSGSKASWLLIAEQPPGQDVKGAAMFGAVLLFGLVNLWLLVRGLLSLRR